MKPPAFAKRFGVFCSGCFGLSGLLPKVLTPLGEGIVDVPLKPVFEGAAEQLQERDSQEGCQNRADNQDLNEVEGVIEEHPEGEEEQCGRDGEHLDEPNERARLWGGFRFFHESVERGVGVQNLYITLLLQCQSIYF